MLRRLRYRRLWLALGVLMVVALIVVGLTPGVPGLGFRGADKLEHLLAYLAVTAWFGSLFERSGYPLLALAMIALGIGIEFSQESMALGRRGDVLDAVANTLGVGAGLLAAASSRESWLARFEKWLPAT